MIQIMKIRIPGRRFLFFLPALIIMLFPFFAGCEDSYILVGDCFSDRPEEAEIEINLTINEENRKVPIAIFKGKMESNSIIYSDTCQVEKVHVWLPVDQYYSVVAKYKSGSRIIFAVDGRKLRVVKSTQEDGSDCFQIRGDKMSVQLKY
ncbi:MAG: hypothetical protein U0T82_04650 [Bacteroidales bacterium]